MTQLKLYLLGAPRIELNGEPVGLPRRKVLALLVYMALSPQPLQRLALATLLWPESSNSSARASLRRELHALSNAIGTKWLHSTRDEVGLASGAPVWSDVAAFRMALADAPARGQDALRDAVALYRGDFLTGFTLSDAPAFDDWQFFESENLRRDYAAALAQLAGLMSQAGNYDDAIDHARRWLALDPLEETVHRELMRLYALAGETAAAVRQYDECVRILNEELGVPPEAETEELFEAIRTRQLAPAVQTSPIVPKPPPRTTTRPTETAPATPLLSPAARPLQHNIPPQNAPFVGRQAEIGAILQLLLEQEACRLLTLVGPGGIGKTRLALRVAQELVDASAPRGDATRYRERFSDGVYFVALENASDREQAVAALADAIGLVFQGNGVPHAQLLNMLQNRQMLLILDNVEHLLEQTDLFATILQRAPQIAILATSREALSLQEEWLYGVSGFALPPDDASAETLEHNHAVQLFLQCARRVDSSLHLGNGAMAQVVRICQLVDGLPLGLELAATWVRTLSLAEIANEIAQNLDFLATNQRGVSPRHSSLRGVLEQTWRLLSSAEQNAFCKLSLFQGGFTRQAATRVADTSIVMLAALVRKSIISNVDGRYTMHSLLRQFAAEKLANDPDAADAAAGKHSRYYGTLLRTLHGDLLGDTQAAALEQIGCELKNARYGWQWALNHTAQSAANWQLVDEYIEPLYQFYDTRSRFREGYTLFQQAFESLVLLATAPQAQRVLCRIRSRLGWFAFQIGLSAEASTYLQQSVELLRQIDAPDELIFSLNYLGAIYRYGGAYANARPVLVESQQLCRARNDRFGLTIALNILGQIAYEEGEYDRAEIYCQESLSLRQRIGDRRGTIYSLLYLGLVAQTRGEYAAAVRLLRKSMLISEEHGDRRGVAICLTHLADVEIAMDHPQEAQQLYSESLKIYTEIYNLLGIVTLHIKLGDLACGGGNRDHARQQYEAALQRARDLQLSPQAHRALLGDAQTWLEHNA